VNGEGMGRVVTIVEPKRDRLADTRCQRRGGELAALRGEAGQLRQLLQADTSASVQTRAGERGDQDRAENYARQPGQPGGEPAWSRAICGCAAIVLDGRADASRYAHRGQREGNDVEGEQICVAGVVERRKDDRN